MIGHHDFRIIGQLNILWLSILWKHGHKIYENYPIRFYFLTHWGWVMHICVSKLTIIGSDNGLSPGRRQAIIWTNAGILLIGPNKPQWNLNRDSNIFIQENAFIKVVCEMAAILFQPQFVKMHTCLHCKHCGSRQWMLSSQISGPPFHKHGLISILTWIINHMPSKVWHEISHPLPNSTSEVWEWICNFIPHFMMDEIT